MPAVAKTSQEAIVRAARRLVARRGADALSMDAVGRAVGVRAPSLYKWFANREALLDAVARVALGELSAALMAGAAAAPDDPAGALAALADAYRAFGHDAPHLYALLFTHRPPDDATLPARAAAAEPLLACLRPLVAPDALLPAARLVTAYVHGFVSMELASAFQFGGGVDEAYRFGVRTLLRGLLSGAPGDSRARSAKPLRR